MRYLIGTLACLAILAATFVVTPLLRDQGLPTGGAMMMLVAAMLAITWTAITRGKARPRK